MSKKSLKTVLTFVQDETGSMMSIEKETIDAFNEYFNTLKKEKGIGEVEALVIQFSDNQPEEKVRVLHSGGLDQVPKLSRRNFKPRGVTPLLDAVGTAIKQAEAKKADRYLVIVQTDGIENASRDFDYEQVSKLVKKKDKSKNWTFVFLGAGIEGWAGQAKRFGARAQTVTSYDPGDQIHAYASVAAASGTLLRSANLASADMGVQVQDGIAKRKAEQPKAESKKSK